MCRLFKKLSAFLVVLAAVVWLIPASADAGSCKAANGAACSCGAGQLCVAWDDWCECRMIVK
jgi:hypothetical protein